MSENGRKKILFDLDDTILDFHTAERHALRAAFDELGIDADESTPFAGSSWSWGE